MPKLWLSVEGKASLAIMEPTRQAAVGYVVPGPWPHMRTGSKPRQKMRMRSETSGSTARSSGLGCGCNGWQGWPAG